MSFFDKDTYCGKSKLPEGLHHSAVTTLRCPGCNDRNPTFRERSRPPPGAEIIRVQDDDSPTVPPRPNAPIPSKASRAATHLPSVPGLVLGNADLERQQANQRQADRKTKTGIKPPIPTVHLSIGIARYTWNIVGDDGDWSSAERGKNWSVDLANSEISSRQLVHTLLRELIGQNKRGEVAKWLAPKEEGDWVISHTNPLKHAVREIAPWAEPRLLSDVIEQGAYELKPVGSKRLVQLWLCWQPEQPPVRSPSPVLTPTPVRKAPVKKGKGAKRTIKQEVKAEPLSSAPSTPMTLPKRPRAVSAEMPLSKRPGATTTRALKALIPPKEEDAEEEQWEPLDKLLEGNAGDSEDGDSVV
jgi:hypothetical protein